MEEGQSSTKKKVHSPITETPDNLLPSNLGWVTQENRNQIDQTNHKRSTTTVIIQKNHDQTPMPDWQVGRMRPQVGSKFMGKKKTDASQNHTPESKKAGLTTDNMDPLMAEWLVVSLVWSWSNPFFYWLCRFARGIVLRIWAHICSQICEGFVAGLCGFVRQKLIQDRIENSCCSSIPKGVHLKCQSQLTQGGAQWTLKKTRRKNANKHKKTDFPCKILQGRDVHFLRERREKRFTSTEESFIWHKNSDIKTAIHWPKMQKMTQNWQEIGHRGK